MLNLKNGIREALIKNKNFFINNGRIEFILTAVQKDGEEEFKIFSPVEEFEKELGQKIDDSNLDKILETKHFEEFIVYHFNKMVERWFDIYQDIEFK
ncbi:hypothetical protein NHG23_08735 [Aerococcaceae bacterium NML190073]|nr:hypothetical protein [Aerococcaceae bacterium NML190073]